jgi:hypothetical protein
MQYILHFKLLPSLFYVLSAEKKLKLAVNITPSFYSFPKCFPTLNKNETLCVQELKVLLFREEWLQTSR